MLLDGNDVDLGSPSNRKHAMKILSSSFGYEWIILSDDSAFAAYTCGTELSMPNLFINGTKLIVDDENYVSKIRHVIELVFEGVPSNE